MYENVYNTISEAALKIFLSGFIFKNSDDPDYFTESFPSEFNRGWLDGFTIFFQALIIVVIHAVIQEYILDVSRVA